MSTSATKDAGAGFAERAGLFLVRGLLLALATLVVYLWVARAGSDLTWDEALNFRVYARSPITAIALYNEYNNHPLESLIKSIFYSVLGLDAPSVLRITGFLFVAAWVAIGWALFRRTEKSGDLVGATVLALLMLVTRAFSYQAMELRGYFLSILLQFLYFFLLVRETGLIGGPEGAAPPAWTRRTVVKYGLLAGLIVFTLPSNVIAIPPLVVLTVVAFRERGSRIGAADVRRFLQLGVVSAGFSILLYVPIMLGIWFGFSVFHNQVARPSTEVAAALVREITLVVTQFAPRGMNAAAFGWAFLALFAIALVAALRPQRRMTRIGLLVLGTALFVRLLFAAFVSYQTRVRCALVPALAIGVFLIVHDLAGRWSPRAQIAASLVLVVASFGLVPVLVEEATPYRIPSDVSGFLEMYCRPESRNVLIVHASLEDPLIPVGRAFGADHVVSSMRDMDARFRGEAPPSKHAPGTWKRKLRDFILPEEPVRPIDASKVEVLVVIDDDSMDKAASRWKHPVLDGIKKRLPKVTEFRRAEYHIFVFEPQG